MKTNQDILKEINNRLEKYYLSRIINIQEQNFSEAEIEDNMFFALFYLKEWILKKDLEYQDEIRSIKYKLTNIK
jgi:hypothetical protein